MNWIWIEQRANLQDKCLPRESSNLSETRHIFHDENFRFLSPSLSRPKIIAFESKITGREVFQFDEFCERESRKVRYEFSIKFLERSPNVSFPIVKRWTAFLEKLFQRAFLHDRAHRAFFFLGRNWIVVTDSSENFISALDTFRRLSRAIIEKSCSQQMNVTREGENFDREPKREISMRGISIRGRFDREWEIKRWDGNYEANRKMDTLPPSFFLEIYSETPCSWMRDVEKFLE